MPMPPDLVQHLQTLEPAGETPVLAIFDLDRTLILGYSVLALMWEYVRKGDRSKAAAAKELLAHMDRRGARRSSASLYKQLISGLAGESEACLQAAGEAAFDQHVAASIFREARQLLEAHRAMGHRVVIISAATRYQVAPVARALGVEHFSCTELEVEEGRFTGRIKGQLCYGEGKVNAARRYIRRWGARFRDTWFYSDSKDDLPLLRKVGNPVATNPSEGLAAYAGEHDWPVLRFSSRGKPGAESLLRTALAANSVITAAVAGAATWLWSRSPREAGNRMVSCLGDVGSALAGLDFEIRGTEHLHAVRPAIFIFNHQSYLDSLVMAHLLRRDFVAFVKQEVADNPLLGPILRAHGTIFVSRGAQDQSGCMDQARVAIEGGKSLAIAPEGTRSATGELLPFKPGAFLLARRMGVPVVPVVLHNVADALPKGRFLLRPATIEITILPPLMPDEIRNARRAAESTAASYRQTLREGWPRLESLPLESLPEAVA